MKTLADFKRAMKVGSYWTGFNHLYKSSLGLREVSKVQSNAFAFLIPESGQNSWCDFPKAKDIEFGEDGSVNIYGKWRDEERVLKMTYTPHDHERGNEIAQEIIGRAK